MGRPNDEEPFLRLVGGTDYEKKKLGIPVAHRGVMFSRILPGQHPQENTRLLEAGFVKEWSKECERYLLERLLNTDPDDPRRNFVPRNEREWEVAHLVAASIIQWLPTSVGCGFLDNAFRRGGGSFEYRLPIPSREKTSW